MAVHVVLLDAALADIDDITAWYRTIGSRQVPRFLAALEQTLDSIERYPESGAVGRHGLRRRHLRAFPHSVWYVYVGDEVMVLAVLHDRRGDEVLNSRTATK
ncbi:MAG: type II toxin-antitoxin system RelE/ParE family toxin [Propionibacteriaceae bacterium]|jgi:plasmid stabilization system protein ParE|nr:type II toxin-antitoxin system RelE/ParE family toxin [Propionibacteriaceae bacterium]